MKSKKIIFGIISLFIVLGFCSISYAFTDELKLSSSSYAGYDLGYLNDGDIIKINEIDSDGDINVYIMNDEQWDEAGGLVWEYLIRWKDVEYLSGLTFDITVDNDYYIVFYNKNLLFSRTIQVDVSIEYKSITITSPTSINTFLTGYNTITWTTTGNLGYVKIQLYNDGVFLETLSSGTDNDGSYSWYIYSDEYTDGSNYQIRISDYYDDTTYDYSDYFTIDCEIPEIEKTITISSPTSTSTFKSGYNYITWTSTGSIDYVKIGLYKDGVFLEIISGYASNDGDYSWQISYYNIYKDGTYYQIRISDYYDNTIDDYSSYFTMEVEQEIIPDEDPYIPDEDKQVIINMLPIIIGIILLIGSVIGIISYVIYRGKKHPKDATIKPEEKPIAKKIEIPKIIYCRECGAKINSERIFCSKCGTKQ